MQEEIKGPLVMVTLPGKYMTRGGLAVEVTDVTETGAHGTIPEVGPARFNTGPKGNTWHVIWSLDGRLWREKESSYDIVGRHITNTFDHAKQGGGQVPGLRPRLGDPRGDAGHQPGRVRRLLLPQLLGHLEGSVSPHRVREPGPAQIVTTEAADMSAAKEQLHEQRPHYRPQPPAGDDPPPRPVPDA